MPVQYWPSRHGGAWFDTPYDPGWLPDMKGFVPYRERVWRRDYKLWWIGDRYVTGVLRMSKEYFGTCIQGREEGFEEPPHPRVPDSGARENRQFQDALFNKVTHFSDFKVLHLDPSAPFELIKLARKTLCRLHHPDRGGDPDKMIAVNDAYERLEGKFTQ